MENKKGGFIGWLVSAGILEFIICHVCASVSVCGSYYIAIAEFGFLEHMRVAPFDLFYFDTYVYLIGWLLFFIVFFMNLSKPELPKAEMKGVEHGSSHFMNDIEKKEFLKNCTTPILQDEDIDFGKPKIDVGEIKKAGDDKHEANT